MVSLPFCRAIAVLERFPTSASTILLRVAADSISCGPLV